jgi:uncharacterized protein YlxW (UPF0749 family)
MDWRIARLESDVEHIQTDVSELKADVRKLKEKVDTIKEAVGDLKAQMETRFAKLDMSRALDKGWWLLMSASLLGVMARGFKWL